MSANGNSHDTNPFEGWLPLEEAARMVGWSRAAVTYWADQGSIKCYLVGQRVRLVRLQEVKSYAATRKRRKNSKQLVDISSSNA
jgi:predicted site-specific integrase-resolvase